MGRLSRSTVRCSLRPWEGPWIPWTPWTLFQCQGALGCEATAMWGQLTRAVLERKREKEAGHCSYFHLPHQELLPPLWEPFKAAQVINKQTSKHTKQFIELHWPMWGAYMSDHSDGQLCKVFQILTGFRGEWVLSSTVWKEGWRWVFWSQLAFDYTLLMRCWKCLKNGERWSAQCFKLDEELEPNAGAFSLQISTMVLCYRMSSCENNILLRDKSTNMREKY